MSFGRIQNEDVKSLAEITGAGGTASQLTNDTKIYVTALGLNKQLSAAITAGDIGGGSGGGGGGKNYAPYNGNFESGITGWGAFYTTFGSDGVPTTITAGSTKVSISHHTSTPLQGTGSLQFDVTTASGSAGHGFISDAMTISDEDLARIFNPMISYNVTAGSTNLDFSGTSTQTLEIWIYNVGLAAWTQPSCYRGLNTKGIPGIWQGEFQTDSQNTSSKNQYRFAVIIKNAPAGTATMLYDTFIFSRGVKVYGAPLMDWQQYTLTIGADTTPPTPGSDAVSKAFWRRVGDSMEISFDYYQTIAGSAGSGNYLFPLPSGHSIDTNKIATIANSSTNRVVGSAMARGSVALVGSVRIASSTQLYLEVGHDTTPVTLVSSGFANLGAATMRYSFTALVPILGWASNTTMSSSDQGRLVAAKYGGTTSSLGGSDGIIKFSTKAFDTTASYDPSTGLFTCPFSGKYRISTKFLTTITLTETQGINVILYKNGAAVSYHNPTKGIAITAGDVCSDFSDIIDCVAGDTLGIYAVTSGSGATIYNSTSWSTCTFERISGPSQIAASEIVKAKYTMNGSTANSSLATSATEILDFNVKSYDSHSCVSTGASFKFTSPKASNYTVSACLQVDAVAALSVGRVIVLKLVKNGVDDKVFASFIYQTTSSCQALLSGSIDVELNAGDYINVQCYQESGVALPITTAGVGNFICIKSDG